MSRVESNTVYLWNPSPPEGGAFDEGQNPELCEDCGKDINDYEYGCKCFSPCCGADMRGGNGDASFGDYGICPDCGEHI